MAMQAIAALRVRIEARSVPVPDSGCRLWEGGLTPSGYGVISIKDHPYRVHRVAYELAFGEIPEGLFVCHHCDVRNCINPYHLFVGTHSDNMLDSVAKKRHRCSRKTHCEQGHLFDEANTYYADGHRHCKACRLQVSRSPQTRQRIREWGIRNRGRKRQLDQQWIARNKERRKEIERLYRERNREALNAKCRAYYYARKAKDG
jgi:hypothetical protein